MSTQIYRRERDEAMQPELERSCRDMPSVRKQQIIDSAISIIGQRGYYGFSVSEVAKSCGLTVAGVLHHFGSKVQLLIELLADRQERDAITILSRLHLTAPAPRLLGWDDNLRVLREVIVRKTEQPEITRLYAMLRAEAMFADHPAFDYFQKRENRSREIIVAMLSERVEDSHSTSLHLIAVMNGLESLWLRDTAAFDLVGEWDRAVERIFGGWANG